jgi:hypothetical protein
MALFDLGGYSHQIHQYPSPDSVQTSSAGRQYTRNILLEYGDRDFALLFAEKLLPVLQDVIKSFLAEPLCGGRCRERNLSI